MMESLGNETETDIHDENSQGKMKMLASNPVLASLAEEKPSIKSFNGAIKKSEPGEVSLPSGSRAKTAYAMNQEVYARKLKKLKQAIKEQIFLNGAVCDEVVHTEEKLSRAKDERRYLLRKVLRLQSASQAVAAIKTEPGTTKSGKSNGVATIASMDGNPTEPANKPKATKRKLNTSASGGSGKSGSSSILTPVQVPLDGKKKTVKDTDSGPSKPKKSKTMGKKIIPPLMLDPLGRPVFPMVLGNVTLHSIGEIIVDRPSFNSPESIYPVGYCSTRVYASLNKVDRKCLYTCKISDQNDGPLFEIASEESPDVVFKANQPTECHALLIRALNKSSGREKLHTESQSGLNFFGLAHPVIQNLIQSCPGARKCTKYKWVKFEINKTETNENMTVGVTDPSVSYEALLSLFDSGSAAGIPPVLDQSNNLRSLLTKGGTKH